MDQLHGIIQEKWCGGAVVGCVGLNERFGFVLE